MLSQFLIKPEKFVQNKNENHNTSRKNIYRKICFTYYLIQTLTFYSQNFLCEKIYTFENHKKLSLSIKDKINKYETNTFMDAKALEEIYNISYSYNEIKVKHVDEWF